MPHPLDWHAAHAIIIVNLFIGALASRFCYELRFFKGNEIIFSPFAISRSVSGIFVKNLYLFMSRVAATALAKDLHAE